MSDDPIQVRTEDFDAALAELRTAVRAAGGGQREVTLLAVAAAVRTGPIGPHGWSLPAVLRDTATQLRDGIPVEQVLKDLRK